LRRPRRHSPQHGFTLIEMMVALVLFAAVTVGMMSVAVTMTNGYRDQEVTIATETSTRSTLELLSQGLRGASPGVPKPDNVTQIHACGTAVQNAFRVENNLVVAGLASTPDAFTVVMPWGSVLTTTTTTLTTTTVDVRNPAELLVGDQVLITDNNTGHIYRIAGKVGSTLTFDALGACAGNAPSAGGLPIGGYPPGSVVIRVVRARFSVGFLAGDPVPFLFMDPDAEGPAVAEPIAEGIEDMQIVVGVDTNADGVLSIESATAGADEWFGNVVGEASYAGVTGVRAVRITLVARTAKEATGINAYRLPAIEDRVINATTDNFRRRLLKSTIEVRNLGGSP
jgi:prepilin-type N-terminal cleavage/methylation domain-containing protein